MTRGGQRNPIDPLLIVESSRVSLPSKRVRGIDYPETVGNTVVLNSRVNPGSSKGQLLPDYLLKLTGILPLGKKRATSLTEEDAPPTKKKKRKHLFSKSNSILLTF